MLHQIYQNQSTRAVLLVDVHFAGRHNTRCSSIHAGLWLNLIQGEGEKIKEKEEICRRWGKRDRSRIEEVGYEMKAESQSVWHIHRDRQAALKQQELSVVFLLALFFLCVSVICTLEKNPHHLPSSFLSSPAQPFYLISQFCSCCSA